MSEKFTKGPWGIEQTIDTNWIGPMRKSGDGKIDEIVFSNDRAGLHPHILERNDANAHLIAAAPELFSALESLVNFPHTHECLLTELALWGQARAALSRAKGGKE